MKRTTTEKLHLVFLVSFFALATLLMLAACQTTAGARMTPAEITAKICPPLEATISVLQFSPAITDGAKEEIARGAPLVHSLCAPGAVADVTGLADLADRTLPMLMKAVADSTMDDKDKQNLLLAIALVQITVNTVIDREARSRGPAGDATAERDEGAPAAVEGIPCAGRSPCGGPSSDAPGRHP